MAASPRGTWFNGAVFEPPVLYARATDGVNIAYSAFGNTEGGVPLVCLRPPQLSHMALEFNLPFETRWHEFETLAANRLIVRLDPRSSGLSDRGIEDISLESRCRDIDAVVDRLGLERFALQGQLHTGSWAIAYAAAHPERVSHLILTQSYTRGADHWNAPARQALESLIELDWVTYTEAMMSNAFAWAPGELPRALAAMMRSAVTQQDFMAFLKMERDCDVSELLAQVQCPVLVAHFELNAITSQDTARRIAANARDGRLLLPKSLPESLRAYTNFLDESAALEPGAAPADDGGLRIFLVASSRAQPGVIERSIVDYGGQPVSSMAGTAISHFASAQGAISCARALAEQTSAAIGIHAGEPGREQLDHADPALVTAVLIAGLAAGGQVLLSNVVREIAAGKGFGFEPFDAGVPGEEGEDVRLFTLR